MSDLNIAMILRLVDQVSGPAQRVVGTMRNVNAAVGGAGQGMITVSNQLGAAQAQQTAIIQRQALGLGALAASAYGLMRPSVEFEAAMDRVGAVAKASDTQLALLSTTAQHLGATTPWAASQAANGMQFLTQAGFDVNQTIAAMPGMLNLASAGAEDLGTSADIASNVLTGFNLEAEETGRVADVLTNAFTNSNTNLRMLGETMKYVAPSAAAVGIPLEEAAAMAGKLGDAGIQGSMGGTALRAMISRLSGPTGAAAGALKKLGVETADADGNLRPMIDVLAELDAAMKPLGTAQQGLLRKIIFGEEASAAAEVLMAQAGTGALRAFADEMYEQGSAARVAEEQNANFAGLLKQIRSVTEAVSITIGTMFLPALSDMARELIPMLASLNEWAAANPELVLALGQLAMWLVGIKIAVLALRVAFLPLLGVLKNVAWALGWIMKIAAMANPFGALIAGAALLTAAIFAPWDRIEAYIDEKLSGISLYDSGKRMIQTLWDGAVALLSQMVAAIQSELLEIVPDWMLRAADAQAGVARSSARIDTRAPIVPRARGGDVTQTNNITVHALPGQSTEEIADRVVAKIQAPGAAIRRQQLTDMPEDAQ